MLIGGFLGPIAQHGCIQDLDLATLHSDCSAAFQLAQGASHDFPDCSEASSKLILGDMRIGLTAKLLRR